MMWKPFFAAACAAALAVPAAFAQGSTGGGKPSLSLSFSFANGKVQDGTVERVKVASVEGNPDNLGIESVPVANWIDLDDKTVTASSKAIDASDVIPAGDTRACNFTLPAPVLVSYSAANGWSYSATGTRSFLRTYLDDGENPNNDNKGARITVDNVPFTRYDVIVYLATDAQNAKFLPVTVNEKKYIGIEEAKGGSQIVTDNTTTWGVSQQAVANLGKNALRVNGLEETTLTIEGTPNSVGGGRCGIAAFQIVCAKGGELRTSTQPVLSLNFASGRTDNDDGIAESTMSGKEGNYGLAVAPADTWVDLTGAVDTDTQRNVTKLHGNPTAADWSAATVTWKAKNTWSYDSDAAADAEPFLPTYLGDGAGNGANGVAVSVSSVPFEAYDAIVYFSNDAGRKYRPVQINDNYYTYNDAYGAIVVGGVADATQQQDPNAFGAVGQQATAKLGVNALRVNGLKGDFSLQGATVTVEDGIASSTYDRCGIAAVQLVARQLITVSGQADWATLTDGLDLTQPLLVVVQDGASITGDVTLPADTILDFSDYTFGETAPFTDTLTMNGGTIRLPGGFESGKIATVFSGNNFHCFIAGKPVWLSKNPGDGALSVSYMWTGLAGDTRWSNPGNWSSLVVPGENADVLFMPAASQPETVTLDTAATVASVTITGPASGTAASLAIQAQEGGSLTVSGQMLTTGNVTVTQSADITVRGATKTGVFYPGTLYETTQPVQAGFHIHQGKWQIRSGMLDMPTDGGANTGEAGISGGGTLIVGGGDASGATLAVRQIRPIMYGQVLTSANGTLRVAAGGTLTATEAVTLAVSYGQPYTVDLAGGTIETPTLATFAGVTVSDDSSLRAPNGKTLNVTLPRGSSGDALTGTDGVTLSGTVTIPSELTDYTGTLTVSAGSALTLSANARPSLVLVSGATEAKTSLTVTRTDDEAENGTIVFPTSMTAAPTNVTYTVNGLDEEEKKTLSVDVSEGQLTLSWEVKRPTLSTTSDWSTTDNWTNLPDGTTPTYPTSDSVTLDGTKSPITVTLDTDLSKMTSIFVKGNVTLVTTGYQSTIPACVALTEVGTTLTVDADFSGAWELPAGMTLQVSEGFTSFAGLTLKGEVVILKEASGTLGEPNTIEAPLPVEFNGGLTIAASNLTLKSMYNVGKTLVLNGENIALTGGGRFFTDTGTQVVNTGIGNAITGVTGLNGSLAVEGGTLALTLGASPTNTFSGATIAGGATLTLAAVPAESGVTTARGWFFPVTGDGSLEIEVGDYDFRPMFSAVSQEATTLPKHLIFTATAAEQAAGVISCLNNANSATLPGGLKVTVNPAEGGGAWAPKAVLEQGGNSYLRIYNQLPTNLPAGVDEAVAAAIQQAAQSAGIENKGYTVRLTTGGGKSVEATAAALNGVLGCFTGLTATASADKATLTYAYEFGISGVRRTKTGWEVVVKVTGAGGTPAGFAAGNDYTVNGATVESPDVSQAAQGEVVLSVTGELTEVSVSVDRPAEAAEQP